MNYQERLARHRFGFECDGASAFYAAALVISAVSTGYSIDAQRKNASATEAYQAQATASAAKAARYQQEAIREQQAQEQESSARGEESARRTNQKAVSNAVTAIGEAGASGNTAQALLDEYNQQFGQYKEAIRRQSTLNDTSADAKVEAIGLGAENNFININRPIDQPNYAAAGLTFAGQAMSAYRAYNPDAFQHSPKIDGKQYVSNNPNNLKVDRVGSFYA